MLTITSGPYHVAGSSRLFCNAVCPICNKELPYISYTWASRHKSCGCLKRAKEYKTWQTQVKNNKTDFPERWQDFQTFLSEVGPIPKHLTSFRITKHGWTDRRKVSLAKGDRKHCWTIDEITKDGNYIARCVCGVVQEISANTKRVACGKCSIQTNARTKRRLKRK